MKWRPQSFSEAVLPLETMSAIIGHGVFQYPPGRRHTLLSLIYAITVSLLYCTTIGFSLKLCFESSWYKYASQIFFRIFYSAAVLAAICQILSWYHARVRTHTINFQSCGATKTRHRVVTIFHLSFFPLFIVWEQRFSHFVQKMSKIDETLLELGATFDYTGTMNMEIVLIVSWILSYSILNAIDVLWLFSLMPISHILIVITVFHHPLHINCIVIINFAVAARLVKMRFHKANELLEKIAAPVRRPVNNQAWRYLGNKLSISTLTRSTKNIFIKNADYRKNVMQIIQHVHLELSTISRELNRAYGVQVALEITAYFALLTGLLYDIYKVGSDPSVPRRHWRIIVHCIWCTTYLTKLILMNEACEAVSCEAHRTVNILHRMDGTSGDSEFSDEIEQFSLQIMQNRVVFSPAGLITLGWKFVRGFLGTVTTYLVILVQMG